jgi:nucleoside-diphosphate-sugar epimerase
LAAQSEIEYTLFNIGWFMDYFIPTKNSYMKSIIPVWPLDLEKKTLRIAGTGEEKLSFTSARDAAKALVALVGAPKWVFSYFSYFC